MRDDRYEALIQGLALMDEAYNRVVVGGGISGLAAHRGASSSKMTLFGAVKLE
jgi:hypothetical protein